MFWQWNQTGNEEQKGNKNVFQYLVTKQYTSYQNLWDAAKAVLVEIHSTKYIKKVLSQ